MLFTFPSRYWFTIGRRKIFSLRRWSSRIPAEFPVFRGTWEHRQETHRFRLRGCHPLWPDFPDRSTSDGFCNSLEKWRLLQAGPSTPTAQRSPALTCNWFRLFPVRSPLLGESRLLSLPEVTEMFQFSSSASMTLCIQVRIPQVCPRWVPPFGNPRVKGCLPPYRGLSQAAASFIVFLSQGIHHTLLLRFSHTFILKVFIS